MMRTASKPAVHADSRFNRVFAFITLLMVVCGLCLLSVAFGTRDVSWADVTGALQGHTRTVGEAAVAMRIPRTVLAAIVGASLGLAGAVMQGITRNPLADPGIFGVNIGAAFFVVIGLAWFGIDELESYVWMAILGSAVTALFVYTIGAMGRGGATPLKLTLAGAATSAALSCFTLAVVLPRNDIAGGVRSWQVGGVGGATFEAMHYVLPFILVGLLITIVTARKLNTLALGDELAAGLGENVVLARGLSGLGAILLCGASTAICGPIGFVGLVVPHFCRLLVGVDHRWLLPFSALGGASLLVLSDVLGRLISRPSELAVGVVTAFIGAPFFIWVVRRQRVREL
ncbi:FecCD family ABC transporter permease [Vibrio furnissii]|uniref:FecCD family ABC transporter permease n=1 Tax=Vibrio furnissii TaxID=29494 RepID=UPI0001B92C8B|nr:iron ABC transporter permease [Vibrio furnissii]EEX41705.1 transport system permease protein [Vibrio furnissii CIP 102972]QDC93048.1 iron ABC transporter permease [Vibrio furnissii]UON48325.1 iron ABC transporter permease [Vibrio furnissii]SUP45453.1 Ferric vibriobactin ABC transporter, permease protein [Vibrio furnissii]